MTKDKEAVLDRAFEELVEPTIIANLEEIELSAEEIVHINKQAADAVMMELYEKGSLQTEDL